jgi:phosphosulfolactate synthase (CoM biosynthesis protein A)
VANEAGPVWKIVTTTPEALVDRASLAVVEVVEVDEGVELELDELGVDVIEGLVELPPRGVDDVVEIVDVDEGVELLGEVGEDDPEPGKLPK